MRDRRPAGLHGVKKVTRGMSFNGEYNAVLYDPGKVTLPEMENALKRAGAYKSTKE